MRVITTVDALLEPERMHVYRAASEQLLEAALLPGVHDSRAVVVGPIDKDLGNGASKIMSQFWVPLINGMWGKVGPIPSQLQVQFLTFYYFWRDHMGPSQHINQTPVDEK